MKYFFFVFLGLPLCVLRCAGESGSVKDATTAPIQVVRTFADLKSQPSVALGTGMAHLGIEAQSAPNGSAVLLYCLTEGYSLPHKWETSRLGPFKVEIRHRSNTLERVEESWSTVWTDPPDISHSTALFSKSIPLDQTGKFLVRILTLNGDPIAETEVTATHEKVHAWMPLEGGKSELHKNNRGEFEALARVRNMGNGIAVPDSDGMMPAFFQSPGDVEKPEDSGKIPNFGPDVRIENVSDARLPALLAGKAGFGLTVKATGTDLVVLSEEDIVLPYSSNHFLVRWWVNGEPYCPRPRNPEPLGGGGRKASGKRLLMHLDFIPNRIGAKSGDEVEMQLLYCKSGWKFVLCDLQRDAVSGGLRGPDLLVSNRLHIDWEKNNVRQQSAPADVDRPSR